MKGEWGNKILITFAPRGYFAKHRKQMFWIIATRIEGHIDSALHCEARRKYKEIGGMDVDTSKYSNKNWWTWIKAAAE